VLDQTAIGKPWSRIDTPEDDRKRSTDCIL
jgi:hypothetical protein